MSPAYVICREARRRARFSQRELAARAGVSPSTVARIERARMEPTLDLLLRLVAVCGLELRLQLADGVPSAIQPHRLPVEARLRENDRLSALWAAGVKARRRPQRAARQ